MSMMSDGWLSWSVGGVVFVGVAVLVASQFSPEARLRRRRRKSHSPIVSKTRRPTVKFSVTVPKEKSERDGR